MNFLLWYLPYAMFSGACDVVLSESETLRRAGALGVDEARECLGETARQVEEHDLLSLFGGPAQAGAQNFDELERDFRFPRVPPAGSPRRIARSPPLRWRRP
jgi:hypothetical protein